MKNSKSKLISVLLSLAMMFCLMPTAVFAAEEMATATNGTTITKETTQENLNDWAGEGAIEITASGDVTTVRLLKNFNFSNGTTPITFGSGSADDVMVLDLNGHSISSTTMVIVSRCDLTIKDSATGGKIFMDTSSKPASAFSAIVNQKKLTIENGTFEAKIHDSQWSGGVIGSAVAGVETVINGGEFISNATTISVSSGNTTVNGGVFSAGKYGVYARNTAVVDFPADTEAVVTSENFPIVVGESSSDQGKVNIDGGDFSGTSATALVGKTGEANPTEQVNISGGTFTNSPADYVENGVFVVKDSSSYGVGDEATAIVENAKAGDTLTFLQYDSEIIVPEGVEIKNDTGSPITVNGNTVENGQEATATHNTIKTEAKDASCTEQGNIAYWYCTICDKYYSDEECNNEITKEETVIAKTAHTYKDGVCTVCGAKDPNYQSAAGSTDSQSDANVKTGDDSNMLPIIALMSLAAAGIAGTALYGRRKRMQ